MLAALGVEGRLKTAFQVAFVLNPLMWNAVGFAGHTTTMAIPLLIIGITAAARGRVGATALSAVALLLFRDDLGLAIAAIAAIGFVNDRDRRWTRWGAIAAGAMLWEAIGGEIALGLGVDRWWLQRFTYLGTGPVDVMHPSVPQRARADRAAVQRRIARAGDALARDGGVPPGARAEATAAHARRRAARCSRRRTATCTAPTSTTARSWCRSSSGRQSAARSGGRRSPASRCTRSCSPSPRPASSSSTARWRPATSSAAR